jgi:hypothetical protein
MWRYRLIVACVCLAPFAAPVGHAADQTSNLNHINHSSEGYRAPQGFGRYAWNTPLGKVDRLEPEPVYVRVAHSAGKVTYFDFSCWQQLAGGNGELTGGTDQALAMKTCRQTDGAGFHALAEYYVDAQGFRINAERGGKAVLFPVTYQFCAHWTGFSNSLKGDPQEQMRLCGARLHFRSETAAEELAISEFTHITTYERVLNWLVDTHGEPEDYKREGEVFIPELLPEREREKALAKNRHSSWYWCRPRREELKPQCSASVALIFDSQTGRGQVLYLTPAVWAYAHARQFGGAEGDPLYRLLHGDIGQPTVQHQCMDSFLCRPRPPKVMPEKMLERFRLSNKTSDAKN